MRILILLFLLIPSLLFSQSANKNSFQVDLGGLAGVYYAYDNVNLGETTKKINAAGTGLNFKLNYFSTDRFSIGAQVKILNYPANEDSTRIVNEARSGAIFLGTDYYYCNKPKFNAFIGAELGVHGFNYKRTITDSTSRTVGDVHAEGMAIGVHTGFRWFFAKHFGLFLSLGYNAYPMQVTSFTINNTEQSLLDYVPVENVILNFRGFELNAGISLKF